jgi:membrane protein
MNTDNKNFSAVSSRIIEWADAPAPERPRLLGMVHGLTKIILTTLFETSSNRLSMRAAALTYALLLSMVPLLATSTAVVKGLGGGDQLRTVVFHYIDSLEQSSATVSRLLPTTPETDGSADNQDKNTSTDGAGQSPPATDLVSQLRSIANQIFSYVDKTNFATLGTFGIVGILLSAVLILNQIETAMNSIWHVASGRSILRKVSDYLTLLVLTPISLNVALAAGAVVENQSALQHIERIMPASWIQVIILKGVPVLLLSATLYVLYLFFPNTNPKIRPTAIGALLAGILWFITQNIYISLQVGVAKYNTIYGSFASIPLFLSWMYLGWLFVLIGAQVAYAIEHFASYSLLKKPLSPAQLLSAAFDIGELINTRFRENRGASLAAINTACFSYQPETINQAVQRLEQGGIIHRNPESGEFMPSLPPEHITTQKIITAVLDDQTPQSTGGLLAREAIQNIAGRSQKTEHRKTVAADS